MKILEHFFKTCAGDRLGIEMSTKPNQNNNFRGSKLILYRGVMLDLNLRKIKKKIKIECVGAYF